MADEPITKPVADSCLSRASSAGYEPLQLPRGRRLGGSLDAPAGHPFIDCWRRARRLIHAIWACRAQRGQGAPATVGTRRLCRPTRPRSAAERGERSDVFRARVARFSYALFLLRLLFHVRSVSGGLERWCIRRNRWYVPVRTLGHLARSACTVRCCFAWSWPSDAVRSDRRAWHRRTDALSQSREVRAAHSSSVCTDARFGGSSNRLRLRNTLPLAATAAAPQGGPTLYRCGGWRCGSTGCCAAQRFAPHRVPEFDWALLGRHP